MHPTVVMLAVASLLRGCQSAQWTASSPPDGTTMYACSGDTATLAWKYTLGSGDKLGKILWYRHRNSEEMVAVSTGGHFSAKKPFRNFIRDVGNAGIVLNQVISTDSGNYSVIVHVYDASGLRISLTRSVYVQIDGQLKMPKGPIQASHGDQAVLDPSTDHSAFQLRCGHFMFHGDPPYMAEWTTPSGQNVTSSDYSDGYFNLLLDSPIQGGNYTCRVPQHLACLGSAHQGEATVYVGELRARLCVLERANERLTERLAHTTSELKHSKTELNQTRVELSESVSEIKSTLIQMESDLRSRVQDLENTTRRHVSLTARRQVSLDAPQQVSFHARMSSNQLLHNSYVLRLSKVYSNDGNAYSSTTGVFTAPYNATYFFIASTASDSIYHAEMELVVDGTVVGLAYAHKRRSYNEMATCHAVVGLRLGQRVWLRCKNKGLFNHLNTYFSGFLVYM